jgi:DNA helicase-2/ATP-dependent DNA helicase PcrA
MAKRYVLKKPEETRDPSILDALNDEQRKAAEHVDGPLLILAGAGSGKTRVVTHRIAHMVRNEGVSPDEILAVTFTNKAAGEMRERVDELLGAEYSDEAWRVTISTFHSLGARLLRRHADRLGLDRRFIIYDQDDQTALIKKVLVDNDRDKDRKEVRRLRNFIESMKNAGRTPEQAHEVAYSASVEEDVWFYEMYQQELRSANCVDFGDLILGVLEMFRDDPELAKSYSEQWRYVMVDEFQDTNPAQYELLEHLTVAHDNLCVVGDDDQAIYRWRGATVRNILDFDEDFPETEVVKLEQNYRSTQVILDAANDVIQHNEGRRQKRLWTEHAGGDPITCFSATDDREEAIWVAQRIEELHTDGIEYRDMAIFYRTNAQGRAFEEQLRFVGVPYQIVGGLSFYAREEVKDILAYLKVALNPSNEVDLLRVLNKPRRGIGSTTEEKLRVAAALPQIGSIWRAIEWTVEREETETTDDEPPPGWLPGLEHSVIDPELQELQDLRTQTKNGVKKFHDIIAGLRRELQDEPRLAPTVMRLLETLEFRSWLEKDSPERAEDKQRNLHELVNAIDEFEKDGPEEFGSPIDVLRAFLDRSALLASTDTIDEEIGAVTLMTVHSSKGLEFDTVFLAGMEDEIFPSLREETEEELEEERRLAYVAITRAKRKLYVSYAQRRRIWGQYRNTTVSQFLEDIDPQRLQLDPRSAGKLPRSQRGGGRRDHSKSWRRGNIGRDTSAWDFDQSADMTRGSIAKARKASRQKPAFDEYSQLTEWDDDGEWAPDTTRQVTKGDGELVGSICSHSKLGVGEIIAVSGVGDMATLTIRFPGNEEKKIKRKFVKILG